MTRFIQRLAKNYQKLVAKVPARTGPNGGIEPIDVWSAFYDLAEKELVPMDLKYRGHTMFPVREDRSIFVSVASYRDEYCPGTLKSMYEKAQAPELVYIGLVQQNCEAKCRTGVLDHKGTINDAPPDVSCYKEFCASDQGREVCARGQVRLLAINETESLGPASARHFASKLWMGETYFFQIDSHMIFAQNWDQTLISMYQNCPTPNPKRVLTHYPPDTQSKNWEKQAGYRMCDPLFATSDIESEIVRLNAAIPRDKEDKGPRFAPFIAAGFFFAHSSFLGEIPFDPLMPYIFMGEEILLSLRFWTNGWDIFSPNKNVCTHYYVRRHKPKFWETVGRVFKKPGIHTKIQLQVMKRVKNILGYPENSADIIWPPTLLAHLDLYGIGHQRAAQDYMDMVGINVVTKRIKKPIWCHDGRPPPQVE
eukprot:CAMPEP_0113941122 /NCGR_PEP_ID=MMETSP1339-20121228/7110_1 /TAXON_ID=94617 /ORGANISM="Fibrocapsa japonica" /LENGTH=421 /DNA_ID=CAMNT_0000945183 /DNA_START=376 /DNA_END=1641 /DNA_ORIENTATION=- /assembly_acc=CAM_ASM_000762